MKHRLVLAFLLLSTFVFEAYSGIELRSRQMRTSDGLPNNSVRYIYQDSKGFLWLATLNGLSRYDGNSFLTYRPGVGGKVSLTDNRIYDLTEDKDGFLWISTTPELLVAMIYSYRVLWILQDAIGWSRIIQRFLLLEMGMYGFGIRRMVVGESCIRKTDR